VTLRVFMVEDLRGTRDLLTQLFEGTPGFVLAGSATTEAEANLWLEEHREEWDLAVVDLVLATGSGINVVRRARELNATSRIVVLSGYVSDGVSKHLRNLGADMVFDKADTPAFTDWVRSLRGTAS
jgi:two-component system OmpR family response regulator